MRVEASRASAQRIQESQEVDERFEVRDGGTGGVVLLTSSYSEAAFENNIGTYLSKRGGLAKLGSLIGLSYDLTDIQLSAEIFFGCPICFCSPTTEGQGSRDTWTKFGCIRPLQMRRGSAALPPHVRGKHGCRDRYGGRKPDTTSGRLGHVGGNG